VHNDRSARGALGCIAVFMSLTALQAAFFPRSFFDDFPFGRGWVAAEGGTYDEHLVRDVGVLFLALIIVTIWSAWTGNGVVAVAIAWLVQGVLHLWYHVGHLDGLDGLNRIGLVASLAAIPLLALIALVVSSSVTTDRLPLDAGSKAHIPSADKAGSHSGTGERAHQHRSS
jgi:hypothetical protein